MLPLLLGGWLIFHTHSTGRLRAAAGTSQTPSTAYQGVPAEFENCSAIVLGCNELVAYHPRVFTDIVAALRDNIDVLALVNDDAQREQAVGQLVEAGLPADCVDFLVVPGTGMWVRDYGGIFARSRTGKLNVIDTPYVEANRAGDESFPRYLAGYYHLAVQDTPLMIEGGNVISNGSGVAIGSNTVLAVNANRGLDTPGLAREMRDRLGLTTWFNVRALEGEPTHHADMFLTLLSVNLAVVGSYDPAEDPVNAAVLDENARALSTLSTTAGPMKVVRIPMPTHRDGAWRSYTNVIFANGTLLVPTYPDVAPELDKKALALYAQWLPGWKVVGDRLSIDRRQTRGPALHQPQRTRDTRQTVSRHAHLPTALDYRHARAGHRSWTANHRLWRGRSGGRGARADPCRGWGDPVGVRPVARRAAFAAERRPDRINR